MEFSDKMLAVFAAGVRGLIAHRERWRLSVDGEDTGFGPVAIADTAIALYERLLTGSHIDSVTAAQQALGLDENQRGRVQVTLAQADRPDGTLDPLSTGNVAALLYLVATRAPFSPDVILMAAPTYPGHGIKLPALAFGVNHVTRRQRFNGIFIGGQGGEPLEDGTLPYGFEAPMTAQSRPSETDTLEIASAAGREDSFLDPLNYQLRLAGATMQTYDQHAPPSLAGLPFLVTMGRRDQVVRATRERQDHYGHTLAEYPGWGLAVRLHLGRRIVIVEVGNPSRAAGGGVHPRHRMITTSGEAVAADDIESFALFDDPKETVRLIAVPGGLEARMFRGYLEDTETGERSILLYASSQAAEFANPLFFAIPYLPGLTGELTVRPNLEDDLGEQVRVALALRHYVLPNPYVGECRRSAFFGADHLFNPTRDVASRELAFRLGGVVRMVYTPLPGTRTAAVA